jgi:hypothetical protein
MIIVKLDIFDGSPVEVVVRNDIDVARLKRFVSAADNAFNDAERWTKMRDLMTHERAGNNYGWTLGFVMPGDEPDQAIDNFAERDK